MTMYSICRLLSLLACGLIAICTTGNLAAEDGTVQPIPETLEPVYIHGRVVSEAGEGVPGVRVVANHSGFGDTISNAWTNANHTGGNGMADVSDEDGAFRIRVPYAGIGYYLRFAPGGRFHTEGGSAIPPVEGEAESAELVAVPYGRPKTRVVAVSRPDGSPAADVSVTLVSEYGVRWTVQTDEQGRAVFEGLDVAHGLRQACVEITTDDGLVAPIAIVGWRRPPDDPTPVRLTDPATLMGTVQALDTGEPVAGATVIVTPSFASGLEWRTTTEDDGWYQLIDLPPGGYNCRVVSATHSEWHRRGWHWNRRRLELRPGEVTEAERIDVQPRAVLQGRVLGPDGQPVPGAIVACPSHVGDYRNGNDLVFTDELGRFEFRVGQFARAQSPLRVYHPIAGVAWQMLEPMEFGEVREGVELVTGGSIHISGAVTDTAGRPIPGIGCRYVGNRGPTAYTDGDGRYDMGRVLLHPYSEQRPVVPLPVVFFSDRPEVGLQRVSEEQEPPAPGPYYIPASLETRPDHDGHAVVDAVLEQTDLLTFSGMLTGLEGKAYEDVLVYLLPGRVTNADVEARQALQLFLSGRDRTLRESLSVPTLVRSMDRRFGATLEDLAAVQTNEQGLWAMRCLRSDTEPHRAYAGQRDKVVLLPGILEGEELQRASKLEWVTLMVTWGDGRYHLEAPIQLRDNKTDYNVPIRVEPGHVRFELPDAVWDDAIAAALAIQTREGTPEDRRPELLLGVDDPQARQELYVQWTEDRVDAEVEDRIAMGRALFYGGPEQLALMTASMDHEVEFVRLAAANTIANCCGPSALEPLANALLAHEDPGVRRRAAGCLPTFRDRAVIPYLIRALEDEDVEVRRTAVISLATLRADDAFDAIAEVFERDIYEGRGRNSIAYALIDLDIERARAWFLDVAARLDNSHGDYKRVKRDLRHAYQRRETGWFHPAPPLTKPQRDLYWLARHATTIVGETYSDAEVHELIKHMADPDIGRECLAAIRHLRPAGAAPELMRLIRESEEPWQFDSTLLAVGGEPGWWYMVDLYRRDDPRVQGNAPSHKGRALSALGSVGDAGVPMLMLLLHDYRWYHPGRVGMANSRGGGVVWDPGAPPSHAGLSAIGLVLGSHETVQQMPHNRDTFLWDEIDAMKQWWVENAEAFIAGDPTPYPPPVTRYFPPLDP